MERTIRLGYSDLRKQQFGRKHWNKDSFMTWPLLRKGRVFTYAIEVDGRHICHGLSVMARFRFVNTEFDNTTFSRTKPLTFESVPWPVLLSPYEVKLEEIDWKAVEEFFEKLELMVHRGEYKTLVEQAHRRFHPDKWKSRGLLNTVLDDTLRRQLESAGNIVAQATTPIWMNLKSRL